MNHRDPTIKQAGHFRPTPRGGVPFGPPLRRGSSVYPLCQVRHRRRCLMGAKNHAVATRRLLGQAPKGLHASICQKHFDPKRKTSAPIMVYTPIRVML